MERILGALKGHLVHHFVPTSEENGMNQTVRSASPKLCTHGHTILPLWLAWDVQYSQDGVWKGV